MDVSKNENGRDVQPDAEEINILYVAISRAIRGIQLPEAVIEWANRTGKKDLLKGARLAPPSEARDGKQVSKLDGWMSNMDAYFNKVLAGSVDSPEQAARIARFLEEQANKFRGKKCTEHHN